MDPIAGLLDGARACRAFRLPRDDVGQDAVLDRLLIDAVRTHFNRAEQAAPGWYRHARESLAERERVA